MEWNRSQIIFGFATLVQVHKAVKVWLLRSVKLGFTELVLNQCCGAGSGAAEIMWDLEPEPKLNF